MLGYIKLKLPDVFRVSMRGDIFSWSFLWAVERRGETVTFGPSSDCRPLLKQDSSRVSLLCPCTRVGHARPHSPVYSAQGVGLPTPSPTLKVFIIFRHCDYWPEKKIIIVTLAASQDSSLANPFTLHLFSDLFSAPSCHVRFLFRL